MLSNIKRLVINIIIICVLLVLIVSFLLAEFDQGVFINSLLVAGVLLILSSIVIISYLLKFFKENYEGRGLKNGLIEVLYKENLENSKNKQCDKIYSSQNHVETSNRKFMELKIELAKKEVDKGVNNINSLCILEEAIERYIKEESVDDNRYDMLYVSTLKRKLSIKESVIDYGKLIDFLMELGDLEDSKKYCESFLKYKECEEAYLKILKYYYIKNDEKNFYEKFQQLIDSTINFSQDGREIVKFWMES